MKTRNKTKGLIIASIIAFAATIFTACVPTPGGGGITNPNIIHKTWNLSINSKFNWNDTTYNYNLDINNDSIIDIKFICSRHTTYFFGTKMQYNNIYAEGNNIEFAFDSLLNEINENNSKFEDKSYYVGQNKSIVLPNILWSNSLGKSSATLTGIVASGKVDYAALNLSETVNKKLKTNADGTAFSGLRILKDGNYYYGWIKYQIVGLYIPNVTTDITAKILETAVSKNPNEILLAGQK